MRTIRKDRTVGTIGPDGHIYITIDGQDYLAQDVAWMWVNGEWPEYRIEHIDGDKTNNRIANLREVR